MRTFRTYDEWRAAMTSFKTPLHATLARAMANIGREFVKVSKEVMTEWIYDRPIPTKKKHRVEGTGIYNVEGRLRWYRMKTYKSDSIRWHMRRGESITVDGKVIRARPAPKGRTLWRRTGDLRKNEKFTAYPQALTVVVYNLMKYAARRHWLQRTRHPEAVMAPAPFRIETGNRTTAYRQQQISDAVATAIKARLA